MTSNEEVIRKKFWTKKLKEHSKAFAVCITAVIVAFIAALLVLIWFISTSPIGNYGLATIDLWTLDWIIGFLIQYTLWALLFVGAPSALFFGLGGYLWWRSLPEEEKQEFKEREKREKARRKEKYGGSGGFGLIQFIGYALYHLIKGTNNVTFGSLPYTYWLSTWFLTFMWIFIVLGIPIVIIVIIVYFTKWRKKSEDTS
jgi:hypothetical protein